MDIAEMRVFQRRIKQLDPKEELVKLDLDEKTVRYSDRIKQYRQIRDLTKEEIVRAYLVLKLTRTLNYPVDCIELEKTHTIGRREKKTSARIDVLVRRPDNTYATFMIIEVKAPDEYDKQKEEIRTQLFQVAKLEKGTQYLIYYTAYAHENDITERLVSVSYSTFDSYKDWEKDGKPNLMGIPPEYGIVSKPVFTKGGVPDLRKDITKGELERAREDVHDLLWGGGRYVGNEIFNFVMKLFLAKIYDEKETQDGRAYKFQLFYEEGKAEPPEKTTERVNELYKLALKRYLHFPEEEAKDKDVRKIGDKTLDHNKVRIVVESFQDKSLTENTHDVLGDFFERFLWDEFKQSKGQFFTHRNVVNFIIQGISLGDLALKSITEKNELPYLIDPACGSGTFLIESMKTITNHVLANKDRLPHSQNVKEFLARNFPEMRKHAWAEKYLYGVDFNEDLAMASKVNMVMHGDGSVNIESEDALSPFEKFNGARLRSTKGPTELYPKKSNEKFGAILSNPPFAIKLAEETKEDLTSIYTWSTKENSETLFVERWYQLLEPKGRLGVVLPETVFTAIETERTRLMLYRYFHVKAVVSLPYLTFQPFTSTKTSLLFAQKKDPTEVEQYISVWNKYEAEFRKLEKDVVPLRKAHADTLEEFSGTAKREAQDSVKRYLGKKLAKEDSDLSVHELVEKYADELDQVDEEWWVLSHTAQELDYSVLMAHADEIGYKRLKSRKSGEEARPNYLFGTNSKGEIVVGAEGPRTILDELRKTVKWD
ncbi:MAG: N-6 DNA methylase [Nitrososphaerota archaeon]|nr:N-6 DNA methylase [Nitrososphaerota archaeon]